MTAVLLASLLTDNKWVLFVFLVLAVLYLVMRITGRRFRDLKRQTEEWKADLNEKTAKLGAQGRAGAAADLNKVFVDLHEFTREVEGRLDTKITYLRELLEEVESAEQRLDEKLERIGDGGDDQDVAEGAAAIVKRKRATKGRRAVKGTKVDVVVGAEKTAAVPADAIPADAASADELFDRVVELHEAGKSAAQIADSMRLPKGEIELMLNLHEIQKGGAK